MLIIIRMRERERMTMMGPIIMLAMKDLMMIMVVIRRGEGWGEWRR